MLSAIMLINVERGSAGTVSQEIIDIDGVVKVFSVTGRFDLVAIAEVHDMVELSNISNDSFDRIKKITSVETLVSMKVFSTKELEENFSVGL